MVTWPLMNYRETPSHRYYISFIFSCTTCFALSYPPFSTLMYVPLSLYENHAVINRFVTNNTRSGPNDWLILTWKHKVRYRGIKQRASKSQEYRQRPKARKTSSLSLLSCWQFKRTKAIAIRFPWCIWFFCLHGQPFVFTVPPILPPAPTKKEYERSSDKAR